MGQLIRLPGGYFLWSYGGNHALRGGAGSAAHRAYPVACLNLIAGSLRRLRVEPGGRFFPDEAGARPPLAHASRRKIRRGASWRRAFSSMPSTSQTTIIVATSLQPLGPFAPIARTRK